MIEFHPYPKPSAVKKKKRKIVSNRKQLIAECDDLVREILFRTENCCFVTGVKTGRYHPIDNLNGLTVGHFISRGVFLLRWDLDNCHLQSAFSNSHHEKDPGPYENAILLKLGHAVLNRLKRIELENKLRAKTVTSIDIMVIKEKLIKKLNELPQVDLISGD